MQAAFFARSMALLVFPLLLSCSAVTAGPAARAVVVGGVPFYPQDAYQCGPASLAGVMNFWGAGVLPEEIANEIYSPTAKGTLNIDMVTYARRKGFQARHYSGTLRDIRSSVDSGYPLIVLVDRGLWLYRQDHFMVVVGYTDEGLIVNSGRKKSVFLPEKAFLRSWKKTGSWTLLVKP